MSRGKNKRSPSLFFTVVILAVAVFLTTLNRRPVPTIDGAVYASVARNIIETGSWFPLSYQGHLFAEHPPLYVWSIASSYSVFGVNDFAANFPNHLFAALIVLLTAALARRAGLNRGVALMAALTLCLTRDFVLSSVRGYIEPLLILLIYLGLYCTLTQFFRRNPLWSVAAALCVAAAWLAKGPPTLWPTLFFLALLIWRKASYRAKFARITLYVLTLLACGSTMAWFMWNDATGSTAHYINKQILGTALTGRNGAQQFEPFYFAHILWTYYIPWVFLLPFVFYAALRELLGLGKRPEQIPGLDLPAEALFPRPLPTSLFVIFAAGFIFGFSVMKWKFWYYIAPAYPALALAISATVFQKFAGIFERPFVFRLVSGASFLWIAACAIYPVQSWKERIPEVTAFKPIINSAQISGNVLFWHTSRDHNLVATSGEWSFHKPVIKVESTADLNTQYKTGARWLIASHDVYASCKLTEQLCKNAKPLGHTIESVLLLLP